MPDFLRIAATRVQTVLARYGEDLSLPLRQVLCNLEHGLLPSACAIHVHALVELLRGHHDFSDDVQTVHVGHPRSPTTRGVPRPLLHGWTYTRHASPATDGARCIDCVREVARNYQLCPSPV